MTLETWAEPGHLYRARGDEVEPHRPMFTGDVVEDVAIPGVQDSGPAIIVAHPCAMRAGPSLADRVLVAAVEPASAAPPKQWASGFFDRMPLPDLPSGFHVAWLDRIGRATTTDLVGATRIACLSPVGVNLLQQRLVFHLTRFAVPTKQLWEAFGHTYEEADMLEEWLEDSADQAARTATFEEWIRDGDPSRQSRLRDPQQRASVRAELRAAINQRG